MVVLTNFTAIIFYPGAFISTHVDLTILPLPKPSRLYPDLPILSQLLTSSLSQLTDQISQKVGFWLQRKSELAINR